MSLKIDRLNNIFVEEISRIIHSEIKDKEVGFVTITDARITNDLSFAKIYFTTLDNNRGKVINSLKGKITIVLTTHYMEEAESLSDRIGIMANGKLVDIGTAKELIKKTKAKTFEDAFVSIATGGELQ